MLPVSAPAHILSHATAKYTTRVQRKTTEVSQMIATEIPYNNTTLRLLHAIMRGSLVCLIRGPTFLFNCDSVGITRLFIIYSHVLTGDSYNRRSAIPRQQCHGRDRKRAF